MASNDNQLKTVDDFLWTFSTNKIVPHGTMASGFAEEQPVFLTLKEENPNKADMLVTLGGVEPGFISKFNRILDIFDGNDEGEVASARARWKKYSGDASVKLTYWKQDEKGAWQKS